MKTALELTAGTPIKSGTEIAWTLSVTNHGPDTAKGAVLTITLPKGVKFDRLEGATDYSLRGSKLIVRLGDLANNGSSGNVAVVSLVVRAVSPVSLAATVTAETADPNLVNNVATKEVAW